jgi:hypothetical protein
LNKVLLKGVINMTDWRIKGLLVMGGMLMLSMPGWAQRGQGMGIGMGARGSGNAGNCQNLLASLPKQDLGAMEVEGLTYLREEEKLARDVYTQLSSQWGSRIFGNIAQSEQQHFDALKVLLDRYGLSDPAANNAVGVFINPSLRLLYGDLVAQSKISLAAALRVGATIEDLDIHDLDQALAATDNNDLKLVYQNLQNGSRNHMRAFTRQLQALGEIYEAKYVSAAELNEILTGSGGMGMRNRAGQNGMRGIGRGNGTCLFGNTLNSGAGSQGAQ